MANQELQNVLGLLDDIELNEQEIAHINKLLECSLDKLGSEKKDLLTSKIDTITNEKETMDKTEIVENISKTIDPELIKELQGNITKNRELMDYLQNLFFEKMLE